MEFSVLLKYDIAPKLEKMPITAVKRKGMPIDFEISPPIRYIAVRTKKPILSRKNNAPATLPLVGNSNFLYPLKNPMLVKSVSNPSIMRKNATMWDSKYQKVPWNAGGILVTMEIF